MYTRYREHSGLLCFTLFQSLIETTGREAKRHKEARTDIEIVGQYRLTKQAELKARPGGSSLSHRKN